MSAMEFLDLKPKDFIDKIKNEKWATDIEILDQRISKIIQGFKVSFHKALKLLSSFFFFFFKI